MDQLALAFTPPGIGHKQPPIDPIEGFNARLTATHADLLERFRHLELACCGQVPDRIPNDENAATATDFIAQCQLWLKRAEAAHKQEKALFLRAGQAIDAFCKARCERLSAALAPTVARLKTYRDEVAAAEQHRRKKTWEWAAEKARRAFAEAEEYRDQAGLLFKANKATR